MNPWTKLVHFESFIDDPHQANSVPIYQTATFAQTSATTPNAYDYSRSGNPTRSVLQQQVAALENAAYGYVYTSGMAAITAILRILKPGDHLIAGLDIYGGTYRWLTQVLPNLNIDITAVDTTNLNKVANAFTEKTRLVLFETPSNPLLHITPIEALANLTHMQGAKLVVDN